jgi:hypothetical protein
MASVTASTIDRQRPGLGGSTPGFRWQPFALGLVVAFGYFVWRPATPDFGAQTAWAALVHRSGPVPIFARWYGGVPVGGYSVLAPVLMGTAGVAIVGALSGLVAVVASAPLFRLSRSPRLGLSVFAICVAANLLSGRVTFAIGLAAGVGTLLAVSRSRPGISLALGCLTCLASPVAGLILLVPLVAVAYCEPARRRGAIAAGVAVVVTTATLQWAFPLGGYEPFDRRLLLLSVVTQLAAVALPVGRVVRVAALVGTVVIVAAYCVHTALGGNIARLPFLVTPCAVAAQLAFSRRSAAIVSAALCVYPLSQAVSDLVISRDSSTMAAFTAGLARRLANDPIAHTHRIEVVDAGTHTGAVRLTDSGLSVARGWITQVDESDNPLLYGRAPLNAATYRAFLDRTASGYVAVEHAARLDQGARTESALIASGLPYLTPVWSDRYWTLYEVSAAAPVADGVARVVKLTDTGVVVQVTHPGLADINLNWSRYLTVDGGRVIRDGRTVTVDFRVPGQHTLRASWPWDRRSPIDEMSTALAPTIR